MAGSAKGRQLTPGPVARTDEHECRRGVQTRGREIVRPPVIWVKEPGERGRSAQPVKRLEHGVIRSLVRWKNPPA